MSKFRYWVSNLQDWGAIRKILDVLRLQIFGLLYCFLTVEQFKVLQKSSVA
jgi:hypothetical protein